MAAPPITPSWFETVVDLQSARTVKELWAVLLAWHGIRASSAWEEPLMLFMRFHRDQSLDAEVTAALLCTDYRWRKASHHLVERIVASGVLGQGQIEALADWFLEEEFKIEVEGERRRPGGAAATMTTLRRPIWPPMRRWAARQILERDPQRWRDLIGAASTLPSRDAAAAVAGVMDAADHLPPIDLPVVASIGLQHGSGIVRLAALPLLAKLAGVDAALECARADPSAKVRAWKPPHAPEPGHDGDTDEPSGAPRSRFDGQASLFE
jgi:hypothetical protein